MNQEELVKSMMSEQRLDEKESEVAIKMAKINDLLMEVYFPPMLIQFFDSESNQLLDEKIAVLTALKEGKTISDIPNFYDILERYPKKQEQNGVAVTTYWD